MAPVVLMGRPASQTRITLKREGIWVSSGKAMGKARLTGLVPLQSAADIY